MHQPGAATTDVGAALVGRRVVAIVGDGAMLMNNEINTAAQYQAAVLWIVLNDAQPESGEDFGHALTTMKFNGQEILVVGAHNEIFAYYKTALYDALPAK